MAAPQSGKPQPRSVPEARRAKENSPGRTALGLGRQLASPGTGRKMHAGPDSYAPFRGKRVLRAVPSAGALGYALASFGLGPRKNRRGLRRIQRGVILRRRPAFSRVSSSRSLASHDRQLKPIVCPTFTSSRRCCAGTWRRHLPWPRRTIPPARGRGNGLCRGTPASIR